MKPFVVELTGLPGSGKTTAATGACEALVRAGVPCRVADDRVSASQPRLQRVLRRSAYAAGAAALRPHEAARAARALLASGQQQPVDAASLTAQWLATVHVAHRAHAKPGVHLLEEGTAQTIWSACLRSDRLQPQALWPRLPSRAHSDLIVVTRVAAGTAATRLSARASRHSRTQSLAPEAALAELHRGDRLLARVLRCAPAPVVRVDAEQHPAEVAAAVARAVLLALHDRMP